MKYHKCIPLMLLVGLYLLMTYWLFWPYSVMEIEEPIQIMNPDKIAYAGKNLEYELKYTKKVSLQAVVNKNLVNDYIITLSPALGNLPTGKDMKKKVVVSIPGYACPGKYRLRWVATYQVNPLRQIQVEAWSEEFLIRERKK